MTTISPQTKQLADALVKCAADHRMPPGQVSWTIFKLWLKDGVGVSTEGLREVANAIRLLGGWSTFVNAMHPAIATPSTVERAELRGLAKVGRNAQNILATQELFEKRLEELFTRMSKTATAAPFGYSVKKYKGDFDRVVSLFLSDLHFGSKLDAREVRFPYGRKEESRRLASIIHRAAFEFKLDHRDATRLVVWLGGDIIAGIIHDPQAHDPLADQVADAVWLLRQALIVLAGKFKSVEVHCSTGNHDRNVARHQDRAASSKWDSFATHIYIGLKAATLHVPNLKVYIPRTPHIEYHPFPHQRVYLTHGDTCINPGNPGNAIPISRLETQMAKRNNAEVADGHKPFGLFVVGHVHTGSITHLASATLLTNPCLIPPDPYSYSVGYSATKNGQYLIETTDTRLVGDSRMLDVDESVDKDAALDKLIVPWNGDF